MLVAPVRHPLGSCLKGGYRRGWKLFSGGWAQLPPQLHFAKNTHLIRWTTQHKDLAVLRDKIKMEIIRESLRGVWADGGLDEIGLRPIRGPPGGR